MITRISYKKNNNDGLYYSSIMVSHRGLVYAVLDKTKVEWGIYKVETKSDTLLEQGTCESLEKMSLMVRRALTNMGVLFYDGIIRR